MERLSARRTVPQIFIDGQSIGGYDDIPRCHWRIGSLAVITIYRLQKEKGEAFLLPLLSGAVGLNYFTLIAICFGLASSALGTCISRMPSRYVALIPSCLTVCGR
jgi:hypothetical protein